jgi:hypothetical protein
MFEGDVIWMEDYRRHVSDSALSDFRSRTWQKAVDLFLQNRYIDQS